MGTKSDLDEEMGAAEDVQEEIVTRHLRSRMVQTLTRTTRKTTTTIAQATYDGLLLVIQVSNQGRLNTIVFQSPSDNDVYDLYKVGGADYPEDM